MTKFIKVTLTDDKLVHHINPLFIVSIQHDVETNKTILYTMDGNSIYPKESADEIIKKIKDLDKMQFTINS